RPESSPEVYHEAGRSARRSDRALALRLHPDRHSERLHGLILPGACEDEFQLATPALGQRLLGHVEIEESIFKLADPPLSLPAREWVPLLVNAIPVFGFILVGFEERRALGGEPPGIAVTGLSTEHDVHLVARLDRQGHPAVVVFFGQFVGLAGLGFGR